MTKASGGYTVALAPNRTAAQARHSGQQSLHDDFLAHEASAVYPQVRTRRVKIQKEIAAALAADIHC